MATSIVSTSDRPDLVPVVADWLWQAFWRESGKPFEQLLASVQQSAAASLLPRTIVLLAGGEPVGTASLVAHDLDERPDLTPWLAGVYVEPHARGHGYAGDLIIAIEAVARRASIATVWLYTRTAERIYIRAGWQTVDTVHRKGRPYALMKRELVSAMPSPRK